MTAVIEPSRQGRAGSGQTHRPMRAAMPPLGPGALLVILAVAATLLGFGVYLLFTAQIPDPNSGYQPDYIIDGYYYTYLAGEAVREAASPTVSLWDAADALKPNAASFGVVYLTALALRVLQTPEVIVVACIALVYLAITPLILSGRLDRTAAFLPITCLFPYLVVPSKELFIFVGIVLVLLARLEPRRWALGLAGLSLVYLSRPDSALILIAAWGLLWASRRRWLLAIVLATVIGVYLTYVRGPASILSQLVQVQMEYQGVSFCRVGPLSVCIDGLANMEIVYLTRLLTLTALPLKWVADLASAPFESLNPAELVIRVSVALQLGHATFLVWRKFKLRRVARLSYTRARTARNELIAFAALYLSAYGAVVYFQPTRQALLCLFFVMLALSLRDPLPRRARPPASRERLSRAIRAYVVTNRRKGAGFSGI